MTNTEKIKYIKETYKFMSIGGNCADIWYLGPDRLRGPVDNIVVTHYKCFKFLLGNYFADTIVDALQNNKYKTWQKKGLNFDGDSPIAYDFNRYSIRHHNPNSDKYIEEVRKRNNRLVDFYNTLLTNDKYFFVYNLNESDIDRKTHKLISNTLEEKIKFLLKENILEKVIFVETKVINDTNITWNYYSPDTKKLFNKYNAKHICITDMTLNNRQAENESSFNKFITEIAKIL